MKRSPLSLLRFGVDRDGCLNDRPDTVLRLLQGRGTVDHAFSKR